jgi:hypothetical protein
MMLRNRRFNLDYLLVPEGRLQPDSPVEELTCIRVKKDKPLFQMFYELEIPEVSVVLNASDIVVRHQFVRGLKSQRLLIESANPNPIQTFWLYSFSSVDDCLLFGFSLDNCYVTDSDLKLLEGHTQDVSVDKFKKTSQIVKFQEGPLASCFYGYYLFDEARKSEILKINYISCSDGLIAATVTRHFNQKGVQNVEIRLTNICFHTDKCSHNFQSNQPKEHLLLAGFDKIDLLYVQPDIPALTNEADQLHLPQVFFR